MADLIAALSIRCSGHSLLFPGLLDQALKHGAQGLRSGNTLRKRQPEGGPSLLQFDPIGSEAHTAPVAIVGPKERCRVQAAGISVIGIHMFNCPGLAFDESGGVADIGKQVM